MPTPPQVLTAYAHLVAGRYRQAADVMRLHQRRSGPDPVSDNILAAALFNLLEMEQAEFFINRSLAANPLDHERLILRARIRLARKQVATAVAELREAVRLGVRHPAVLTMLGECCTDDFNSAEAEKAYLAALDAAPAFGPAHQGLAVLYNRAGLHEKALPHMRVAVGDPPTQPSILSVHAYYLNFSSLLTPGQIFAEHTRIADLLRGLPRQPPPTNPPDPDRRLRIALLSHDFKQHSCAYFIEPLLAHRDPAHAHVSLFATSAQTDAVTARLRPLADAWKDVSSGDPQALADATRAERIDILIDLGGLTGGARVFAFAARLAPVQITYLGYPNTTGVPGVDYRFVDAVTDPAPAADALATEKLVRLPGCFLCYQPERDAPGPLRGDGPITFGSFNTTEKLSRDTLDLWMRTLLALPGSRLHLKSKAFTDPWIAAQIADALKSRGVEPGRITLEGRTATQREHLARYADIDVCLDTTPYNGTTTTCEALWMGVPVVTLLGDRHAARVGASLLAAAGLTELVARTPEEFVTLATALAADRERLRAYRASLRGRIAASRLTDGPAFCRAFEAACRDAWRAWCAQAAGPRP